MRERETAPLGTVFERVLVCRPLVGRSPSCCFVWSLSVPFNLRGKNSVKAARSVLPFSLRPV